MGCNAALSKLSQLEARVLTSSARFRQQRHPMSSERNFCFFFFLLPTSSTILPSQRALDEVPWPGARYLNDAVRTQPEFNESMVPQILRMSIPPLCFPSFNRMLMKLRGHRGQG